MAKVYFMRHGQASFASDNYDQLSDLGYQQARFTGEFLAAQGVLPDRIISGSLQRQQQTVAGILDGMRHAGVAELPQSEENPSWDEFNHTDVLAVHGVAEYGKDGADLRELLSTQADPERSFQQYFVAAMRRWVEGQHAASYQENFESFVQRIQQAQAQLFDRLHLGERVLVVTSGGPISMVVRDLLGMEVEQALQLNWRLVNGGITKVSVSSRHGPQLVTLNEHLHFNGEKRELLTAR